MNKLYVSNVVSRYSNKVVKDVSSILPKGPASSYKHIQWAGFSLWQAIKKRYELKAIPQEVHVFKMQTLNLKCNGNAKTYITDVKEMRKKIFSDGRR